MNGGRLVMLAVLLLVSASSVVTACTNPCTDSAISSFPFCNPDLDVYTRVTDLVGRLTPEEKVSQLGHTSPGIDRLKIPAYQWWSEALHGVAGSPGVHFGGKVPAATSFPQVIGLGATFNMTLVRMMGNVIATEARAMNNVGQSGLTFFAPNINIYRDPRWGRGQETPGEDPYLSASYAINFVKGTQEGHDVRYLKAAVCCKHFAAYDLENWNGTDRHHFNAIVSDQDMVETYFPAFEACVRDGNVASIMCSYNAVNGVPSCANDLIQNKVTRDQWGFEGFIVSDCGAISNIMATHKYTNTTADTVQVALRGGTDLNCGSFYQKNGMDAYNQKKITDSDLSLAVGRLFGFRFALGMFDPPDNQPYCQITTDAVNTHANQMLALEAARQSIVLLKNDDGVLPLDMKKKVALIGPNSDATTTMQGNYKGTAPYLISPLQGMKNMNISVNQVQGCDVKCASNSGFGAAVSAAKSADVVVVVVGLDEGQESEGHDRTQISLPGMQEQLLDAIKKGISSTTPLIVVLMSGGPVDMTWAKTNANAVLWVGYPGQSGGQAIAEVLFGVVNPSGRLPITFYPADYVNQISFFNMSMRADPGRTYKFYKGNAAYTFGQGMSYTTFSYKWSAVEGNAAGTEPMILSREKLRSQGGVNYTVVVTNTGKMAGAVSVLDFLISIVPDAPMSELIGFQKVFLQPGQSESLFFALPPDNFMQVNGKGVKILHPGEYHVKIGDLMHRVHLI